MTLPSPENNPDLPCRTEVPERHSAWRKVTDLILEHLENGVVPWRCPWSLETGPPRNFYSKLPYRGVNAILLGCRFASSPWWMTYRQARERGGHVRSGETGAVVVKYGTFDLPDGDPESDPRKGLFLKHYAVFNATQIEGIEFPRIPTRPALNATQRIDKAQAIADSMPQRPVIRETGHFRAFYSPSADEVHLPPFSTFENAESYYMTLYHELAHASGHPSRLNRTSLTHHDGFGGKVYSLEELVAEICAAFLGMEADIVQDRHGQSAAYVEGWLSALRSKNHSRWIVQAAGMAAHAADYILGANSGPVPEKP